MKRLVVRLSLLGVLSSAYVIGLSASSQAASPHLQAFCCTAGNGTECCSPNGCSADATTCKKG
jgi:hypothetical protein